MAVWKWVQKYEPHRAFDVKRVRALLVDETYTEVGSFGAWLWMAVEPVHRHILGVYLSRHQNMIVAQLFLRSLVKRHIVYSDGGRWYPEACATLGLMHRLHSPYEKSLMERDNQCIKERIDELDDYLPCTREEYDLADVRNWLNLSVDTHYARRRRISFEGLLRFLGGERPQAYAAQVLQEFVEICMSYTDFGVCSTIVYQKLTILNYGTASINNVWFYTICNIPRS